MKTNITYPFHSVQSKILMVMQFAALICVISFCLTHIDMICTVFFVLHLDFYS